MTSAFPALMQRQLRTSVEHFPTALASLSIGLVLPGMLMCGDAGVSMRSRPLDG